MATYKEVVMRYFAGLWATLGRGAIALQFEIRLFTGEHGTQDWFPLDLNHMLLEHTHPEVTCANIRALQVRRTGVSLHPLHQSEWEFPTFHEGFPGWHQVQPMPVATAHGLGWVMPEQTTAQILSVEQVRLNWGFPRVAHVVRVRVQSPQGVHDGTDPMAAAPDSDEE